jgi:hypothetical protein
LVACCHNKRLVLTMPAVGNFSIVTRSQRSVVILASFFRLRAGNGRTT